MPTFKQHFGIPEATPVDFIDIPLEQDILLFVDPFLIANNRNVAIFNQIYLQMTAFLETLNRTFIVPDNRVDGLQFLDKLHEPNEYHLGYSDTNKGAAISKDRAVIIYDALRNNIFARSSSVTITNEAHNVLLLVTGIGQDIMSDTIENVCRNTFATFTEQQCIRHGIATTSFRRHFFNTTTRLWEFADFNLPSFLGKPIILLPRPIISAPRDYTHHYNYFIAKNRIAQDILSGKLSVDASSKIIKVLKNNQKALIIKYIYEAFKKPKNELIQFVLDYKGTLEEFLDYAKEHYPAVNLDS